MHAWALAYALLLYAAGILWVVGLAWRVALYALTPAPLRIPTMPAPRTRRGVCVRVAGEVGLFTSLFRADKWAWIWGWLFHVSLALVLVQHLRYVFTTVPAWVRWESPFGSLSAFVLIVSLGALLARRILIARVRFLSGPSDYLWLLLFILVAASGTWMRYVRRIDIVRLKVFILGLMALRLEPLPRSPVLLVHLALVAVFLALMPFSKLLHAPGVFFSPTRTQRDKSRVEGSGGAHG